MANSERETVVKFGGSSMADERSVAMVAEIVRSDPRRRIVVVSAPGVSRLFPDRSREKVTDLLFQGRVPEVEKRFLALGQALGVEGRQEIWGKMTGEMGRGLANNPDWLASRGEWLSARLLAEFVGGHFVDASELILFGSDKRFNENSYAVISARLNRTEGLLIVPGFYGMDSRGRIQVFPRGGSDISGAVVARGVNARLYENWTDVDGLMNGDPKIIEYPGIIPEITYEEMRELSDGGASILQSEALRPVYEVGIPINLRNTFNPSERGTMIVTERISSRGEKVLGIAGRKSFMAFQIEQFGMNDTVGSSVAILEAFRKNGVSIEHDISGKDYISVIVDGTDINGNRARIESGIKQSLPGSRVKFVEKLAQISIVGQRLGRYSTEVGLGVFTSLAKLGVDFQTLEYGTKGNSLTVGIDPDRYESVMKALHEVFQLDKNRTVVSV